MSNTASTADGLGSRAERRAHLRHALRSLAYVEIGAENGGVILNIGEGGLAVQAVAAVRQQKLPRIRFQSEPAHSWIETDARLAWASESQTMVGLEFAELPDAAREQIREWIDYEVKGPSEPRSASGEKWSRVASEKRHVELPAAYAPPEVDAAERAEAVATLKRYLVDERNRILLHDLVIGEADRLCAKIAAEANAASANIARGAVLQRLRRYEELTQPLLALMATGCYWGEPTHDAIWAAVIERVASAAHLGSSPAVNPIQGYPALLLMYGGGLAAVAKDKYSTLQALFVTPRIAGLEGEKPAVHRVVAEDVIGEVTRNIEAKEGKSKAPASDYLHEVLRPAVREFLLSDSEYEETFDRLEYLVALMWVDENPRSARLDWIPYDAPLGRFVRESDPAKKGVTQQIQWEIATEKSKWPPLRGKMFGGDVDRVLSVKERYDEALEERLSGEAPPQRY